MGHFDDHGLGRRDKKLAGVCADLGQAFNMDPTLLRIGFAASALILSFQWTIIAYVGAGLWMHFEKRKLRGGGRSARGESRFLGRRSRGSVHDVRTRLDANDRKMMAIDKHLSTPNDELAREIEALREDVK